MTLELKGNALISEFLGATVEPTYINESSGTTWYRVEGDWVVEWRKKGFRTGGFGKKAMLENLDFHKSWDWLMPICKELVFLKEVNDKEGHDRWIKALDSVVIIYDIDLVFSTVIQFIEWYNTQKNL